MESGTMAMLDTPLRPENGYHFGKKAGDMLTGDWETEDGTVQIHENGPLDESDILTGRLMGWGRVVGYTQIPLLVERAEPGYWLFITRFTPDGPEIEINR